MGKTLIQQRRGKGKQRFRAPSHNFIGKVGYPNVDLGETVVGVIADIVHCAAHSAPLMKVEFVDEQKDNKKSKVFLVAPEEVKVGDNLEFGVSAQLKSGNVLPLANIPEGTDVYNIEAKPGDGGKFIRSAGSSAKILTKTEGKVIIIMPSKKKKIFDGKCMATIGSVSGGGHLEKPLLKAGNKHYKMKARNRMYPIVSGVAMNAVAHPFGCKRSSRKGKPTIVPKNAPPGRKVGKLRPSKTGKKR